MQRGPRSLFLIALVSAAVLASPAPLMAQSAAFIRTCFTLTADPSGALAACRALERDRSLSPGERAKMFYFIGHWHLELGQNTLAVPAYTQALALNSSFADAYAERGAAYGRTYNYALALDNFTRYLRLRPSDIAIYRKRAYVYEALGKDDRARADYARALHLNPRDDITYLMRAYLELAEDNDAAAVRDTSRSIAIDPREGASYAGRGYAFFNEGRFAPAARDLATAIRLEYSDAYPVLWLHLARRRLGDDDTSEFSKNRAALSSKLWPAPVVALYSGRVRSTAVFAAAAAPGETCEAHFYVGEWNVLEHRLAAARADIAAAAKLCPRTYTEYAGALAELKRLHEDALR